MAEHDQSTPQSTDHSEHLFTDEPTVQEKPSLPEAPVFASSVSEPSISEVKIKHVVLIVALLSFAYLSFHLIRPYLNPIILAFIISLMIQPLHQWVLKKLRGKKNRAAILSSVLLTVVIFIPFLLVFSSVIGQGVLFFRDSYAWVNAGGASEILQNSMVQRVIEVLKGIIPAEELTTSAITQRLMQASSGIASYLLSISSSVIGNISHFFTQFLLMLFILFFLLRDQALIINTFHHVLPFSRTQEDRLFDEIRIVAKSAILGSFLTALAQGVLGGIAMAICGAPALFWGTMIGFASFIPMIGTALVWVPIAAYLAFTGQTGLAIFLVIWGSAVIGTVDSFLRPFLMKGDNSMDTLLIFLSILGGISYYGLIGLIYGPLIFALTIVFFRLYEKEFRSFLDHQDVT